MTQLKRHDVPNGVSRANWTLAVTGTVDRPLNLDKDELTSLPHERFTGDFQCEEGWAAEDLDWRGVLVGTILDRAEPAETSEYGLVHAMDNDYACSFPLSRLSECVLALQLDGEPLPLAHGGPARLVPTSGERDCWESVKWVGEIEILDHFPSELDTAKSLALSRIE